MLEIAPVRSKIYKSLSSTYRSRCFFDNRLRCIVDLSFVSERNPKKASSVAEMRLMRIK